MIITIKNASCLISFERFLFPDGKQDDCKWTILGK